MSDKNEKNLKPGWRRVKFGDVVRLSKARSQDPLADGIERYVGLEHLEPGDLRIRSWGNVADGVTFTSVFQPGQVLFGKRRAYQRKVAVADFSGVCSGDIYVLETKDAQVLLPELLPFICQTDAFFDHAVGTSAGSLSPRTNWTSLADFVFSLPPVEKQREAVNALLALNKTANCTSNLVAECNTLYLASLDHLLGLTCLPPRALQSADTKTVFPVLELQDVIDQSRPISYGILQPGKEVADGIPMLRTMDFDELGRRERTEVFKVTESVEKTSVSTRLQGGELLISVMATIGRTFVVPDSMAGFNVNRALAVIAPGRGEVSSEYLEAFFHSRYARQTLEADKIGSAQLRINLEQLRKMRLPVPSMAEQQEIVALRSELKRNIADTEARRSSFNEFREKFLREVFD